MRSLERSRSRDIDQKDSEHLGREGQEFSWDDLKNEPFRGDKSDISSVQKSFDDLRAEFDSDFAKELRDKRLEELRAKMDELSSFGKNNK